jgi:RNA polymerase sigma factor (sigma-70 family)
MAVVREVARALAARLHTDAELEELEADGFEGLVRALRDFDSAKGPLVPYVVLRCRGAMIDGLRRRMWISRTQRAVGVTEPIVVSLDHEVAEGLCVADVISDPSSPTADIAIARATSRSVRSAITGLPKQYQRILVARFLQRRRQEDVAAAERVSREQLATIESRILQRLRVAAGVVDAGKLTPEKPKARPAELTEKELHVLRLAAEGASAVETAKKLSKNTETVKTQRKTIIAKLRARNMMNAVAISYQRGLLQ